MLMVVREVREGAAVPEGGGDLRLQACEWATSRWRGFLAVGGEENPSQVPTFHTNTKNSPPLWRLVRVVRAAGWHLMEPGEWRIRVLSSCGAAEQQSAEQPTADCRLSAAGRGNGRKGGRGVTPFVCCFVVCFGALRKTRNLCVVNALPLPQPKPQNRAARRRSLKRKPGGLTPATALS